MDRWEKEGWLLKSTIEKIEVVRTEDNLGLEEVEIVEAEEVDYKSLSKTEVIAELEKREIEFYYPERFINYSKKQILLIIRELEKIPDSFKNNDYYPDY